LIDWTGSVSFSTSGRNRSTGRFSTRKILKEDGRMPTTVQRAPSTVIVAPMIDGSVPKDRRQKASLSSTTVSRPAVPSSSLNSRPRAG
jgi:hypothetical protein